MGPRVVGLAAYHLNFLIATFFASTIGIGAISGVNYAWLIVMTPLGLFGMAISTALFPRMAEQAVRDEEELRDTLSRALRMILYLTIPASVGLMIMAAPLTSFLLRGGAFDASSGDIVIGALVFYSLGLFAHSGIEILSRGFYALADTRTPVTFALISMALNLILCLILVRPFEVNGLAIALSIATIVEFALLFRALDVRMMGIDTGRIVNSLLRTGASTLLMGEVVVLWLLCLHGAGLLDLSSKLETGFAVIVGAALGAATYFYTSRLLRSDEARVLASRLPEGMRRYAG
jgi:putative peptidoglycan lipid II flippase